MLSPKVTMKSVYCNFLIDYLSKDRIFCGFTHGRCGGTREKLLNHEPEACDLQASQVFCQHPK